MGSTISAGTKQSPHMLRRVAGGHFDCVERR